MKRKWVKVFDEPGELRVFRLEDIDDARHKWLSIADQSGGNPDSTTYGPLWVPVGSVVTCDQNGFTAGFSTTTGHQKLVRISPALAYWLTSGNRWVLRVIGNFDISTDEQGCSVVTKQVKR